MDPISTNRGKFYAGMTLSEATQKGIDKRMLGRDFHNIDTNKDGILSNDEIIAERKNELNRSLLSAVADISMVAFDLIFNKGCKGNTLNTLLNVGFGADAAISLYNAFKYNKANKELNQQLKIEA